MPKIEVVFYLPVKNMKILHDNNLSFLIYVVHSSVGPYKGRYASSFLLGLKSFCKVAFCWMRNGICNVKKLKKKKRGK